MLSFPITLIAEGEDSQTAVDRLITKEFGCGLKKPPMLFGEHEIVLDSLRITIKLGIYTGVSDEYFVAHPTDIYIDHVGWEYTRKVLMMSSEEIRLEVKPVLELYLTI